MFSKTWRQILSTFLAGLFAILPLVITVAIALWVINLLRGWIGPQTAIGQALQSIGQGFVSNHLVASILGWFLVLAGIWSLGVLVQGSFRHFLTRFMEGFFKRIPVIGNVYGTASQFVQMLNRSDENELQGMSVVFCRFGGTGGAGILALRPSAKSYQLGGHDYFMVYIPTSPVPMTGGLLFVPVEAVTELQLQVESLMSIYLSMGVTAPSSFVAPALPKK